MSFINSDTTLKVGDLVFSSYHKGENLFKIVSITRRFLTDYDLRYNVYKNAKVGDEYNPLIKIQAIANLSIVNNEKKVIKITKELDAVYLHKVTRETILNHINKLGKLIFDQFEGEGK